jgi:anti-sigma factor RsiW
MSACSEFESLLIDRAIGELSEADKGLVEQHLIECRGCAAEADGLEKMLSAIALRPRSAEERAAVASMAQRTGLAWRRSERRRSMLQGAAAGFIASAAAAVLLMVSLSRRPIGAPTYRTGTDPSVAALENWASPGPFDGSDTEMEDEREQ